MNPHGSTSARLGRLKLMSTLQCVLKNGSKDAIVEMLRPVINFLTETYENDDTVYHVILANARLTQEDIILISKIFRNRGVNPNTPNKKDKTALHLAIETRMKNVTSFFMECRESGGLSHCNSDSALIKCFIDDEYTKFWYQARQNYDNSIFWDSEKIENESATFLEWLISKGIDLERKSSEGRSSVDMALDYNLQHLLPVLLMNVSDKYLIGKNLLHEFLEKNAFRRQTYSYDPGNKWYSEYTSRYAAKIVKILIDRGECNDNWREDVQLAIKKKEDIAIVKMLVDLISGDANKSLVATSILHQLMTYPCENFSHSEVDCYRQILHDLVAKDAKVNRKSELGLTTIQVAIKARNVQGILLSNEASADFSVLTTGNENLLHLLLDGTPTEQDVAIFDLLLSKGCNVNARDSSGLTPLHLAAKNKNVALVKRLIASNAEVNCRDDCERTPLHYTLMHVDSVDMVEMFLENGANVNARDAEGKDPLFLAVRQAPRKCKMVKMLLERGAQVNTLHGVKDMSALKNVVRHVRKPLVAEFLEYGLDVVKDSLFSRLVALHRPDTQNFFELHKIKLKAAAFSCSGFQLRRGKQKLYEKCLKEIEILKTTFIDTRTSLYRLLHMGLNERCIKVNNEKLKSLVNSPVLEKQFPNYAVVILANYREAVVRKSLLGPAKEAWLELTKIYLPDICIECIFSYLSNMNLIDIIGV